MKKLAGYSAPRSKKHKKYKNTGFHKTGLARNRSDHWSILFPLASISYKAVLIMLDYTDLSHQPSKFLVRFQQLFATRVAIRFSPDLDRATRHR